MFACAQEMGIGERVVYMDLEDDPAMTMHRIRMIGAGDDDIRYQFNYLRPEGPHAVDAARQLGQRQADGERRVQERGALQTALARSNPGLIIVDGMSVLYGLHGLNTNDVTSTDVITNWLKSLCRNGRSTVMVIDHTHKGAEKGALADRLAAQGQSWCRARRSRSCPSCSRSRARRATSNS